MDSSMFYRLQEEQRLLEITDELYRELGIDLDLVYQARNDDILARLERVANFKFADEI